MSVFAAQIEPAPVANLHGYLRGHFSHLANEAIEDEVRIVLPAVVLLFKLYSISFVRQNAVMARIDKVDDYANNVCALGLCLCLTVIVLRQWVTVAVLQ